MKRPVPYPEARRILDNVPLSSAFWLCTNDNLRSLDKIAETLKNVDDDVFRYHVTRDKNDFEVWIRDILLDKELARDIARVKTRETLIRKITERVLDLRKIISKHRAILKRKKTMKSKKTQKHRRKNVKAVKKAVKRVKAKKAKSSLKIKRKRFAKKRVRDLKKAGSKRKRRSK